MQKVVKSDFRHATNLYQRGPIIFTDCFLILYWQTHFVAHLTQLLRRPPTATSHTSSDPPSTPARLWSLLPISGSMLGKEPQPTPRPSCLFSVQHIRLFRWPGIHQQWAQMDGPPMSWIKTCWSLWPRALLHSRSNVLPVSARVNQTTCPFFTSIPRPAVLFVHHVTHR